MDQRRNASTSQNALHSQLSALRQEVWSALSKIDSILATFEPQEIEPPRSSTPSRNLPIPVGQTYPQGLDFRQNPEGLRHAVSDLQGKVRALDANAETLSPEELVHEVMYYTSKARLFQTQASEGSTEWESLVQVVKTLTRIINKYRPGYVYGLAFGHNADWGQKIIDALDVRPPLDLRQ